MTFAELATEFYSRGFDYLNQDTAGRTRAKRWLNQAYLDICESHDWPFLYADASGTAPLSITDVRAVLSVTDSTNDTVLTSIDRRTLNDSSPDLASTGTPTYWYLNSGTSLAVYPANTSVTLSVRYLKVPAELSADADALVIPARFQDLVVDGAAVRAYKDSDNFEAMAYLRAEYDRGVQTMANSLLHRELDRTDSIHAVGGNPGC